MHQQLKGISCVERRTCIFNEFSVSFNNNYMKAVKELFLLIISSGKSVITFIYSELTGIQSLFLVFSSPEIFHNIKDDCND